MPSDIGDLINFSNSPPLFPITPRSTSSFHASVLGESGWQALKPDKPEMWSTSAWNKSKSPAPADEGVRVEEKVDGKEKVKENPSSTPPQDQIEAAVSISNGLDQQVKEKESTSPSTPKERIEASMSTAIGLNPHKAPTASNTPRHLDNHKSTPRPVSGKNIPLPDSPYTSKHNDSDARSITSINSDETTQSKLSTNAKPFSTYTTPPKSIPVIKTSEPPSFFPSPPEDEDIVQTPDVSPDQMDPSYFEPGYGGHLTSASSTGGGLKSPVWFAPPSSRRISITTPEAEVKVEQQQGSTTPLTVKTYDGTADSPISDRHMRENTPRSPSEASSDLPHIEAPAYYEGEEDEPRAHGLPDADRFPGVEQIDHITAHFGSISLTPADGPISVPPHNHTSSEGTSAPTKSAPNPYDVKDGLLSPQHTGDRSLKDEFTEHPDSNSADIGNDTTLVSDGQFDFTGCLDEVNDLEAAWVRFKDGYGQFYASVDEALARLKMELAW